MLWAKIYSLMWTPSPADPRSAFCGFSSPSFRILSNILESYRPCWLSINFVAGCWVIVVCMCYIWQLLNCNFCRGLAGPGRGIASANTALTTNPPRIYYWDPPKGGPKRPVAMQCIYFIGWCRSMGGCISDLFCGRLQLCPSITTWGWLRWRRAAAII